MRSDEITDFSGAINANGIQLESSKDSITQASSDKRYETSGGFVEISSDLPENLDLSRVQLRTEPYYLIQNITVDGSSWFWKFVKWT